MYFFTNVWIIRPGLRPGSTIDMLRAVSQQIFIADVGPDKSVIRLKAVYIVEWKGTTLEHCQSMRGPDTVNTFLLCVGSACSRNTLPDMVADHCFKRPYFPQSLHYFTVSNIIICIHTKHNIISFVMEITQELVQISDK